MAFCLGGTFIKIASEYASKAASYLLSKQRESSLAQPYKPQNINELTFEKLVSLHLMLLSLLNHFGVKFAVFCRHSRTDWFGGSGRSLALRRRFLTSFLGLLILIIGGRVLLGLGLVLAEDLHEDLDALVVLRLLLLLDLFLYATIFIFFGLGSLVRRIVVHCIAAR